MSVATKRVERVAGTTIFFFAIVLVFLAAGVVAQAEAGSGPDARRRSQQWESFGPWVFKFQERGFALHVTLKTDIGVLIPHVQSHPRTEESLLKAFSHGSPLLESDYAKLVPLTGWGHVAPYLYEALYDSVGRILYGLSVAPTTALGDQVIPLRRSGIIRVTVRAFADPAAYATRAASVTDASSEGYWDPTAQELGLYLDRRLFAWLGHQSEIGEGDLNYTLAAARLYVRRLVLSKITHELVHAMQSNVEDKLLQFPLLVEGKALYLASNVSRREELGEFFPITIAGSGKFSGFPERTWPYSFAAISTFRTADSYLIANPRFSVTQVLRLGRSFYAADRKEAAIRYAIASAFVEFLIVADKRIATAWRKVIDDLYDNDAVARAKGDAEALDVAFRTWIGAIGKRWWRNEKAEELQASSLRSVTQTLNDQDFAGAYHRAMAACALKPDHPVAIIYLGDVFYRAFRIYWAYDYYAAAALVQEKRPESSNILVHGRLGDTYYALGDLERALDEFRIATTNISSTTTYRDRLAAYRAGIKQTYIEATRDSGTWRTISHRKQLQSFVDEFFSVVKELQSHKGISDIERLDALESQYSLVRAKIAWSLLPQEDLLIALRAAFLRWSSLANNDPGSDAVQLEALWSLLSSVSREQFIGDIPYFYCYWIEQSEWLAESLDQRILLPDPPGLVRRRGLLGQRLGALAKSYQKQEERERIDMQKKISELRDLTDDQMNQVIQELRRSTSGAAATLGEVNLLISAAQYRETYLALQTMIDTGKAGELRSGRAGISLAPKETRSWLSIMRTNCGPGL